MYQEDHIFGAAPTGQGTVPKESGQPIAFIHQHCIKVDNKTRRYICRYCQKELAKSKIYHHVRKVCSLAPKDARTQEQRKIKSEEYDLYMRATTFKKPFSQPMVLPEAMMQQEWGQTTRLDSLAADTMLASRISLNDMQSPVFCMLVHQIQHFARTNPDAQDYLYNPPNMAVLRQHIVESFSKRKLFMRNLIGQIPGRVSLICDGWHCEAQKRAFYVVSLSSITADRQSLDVILEFKIVNDDDARIVDGSFNVTELVMDVVEEYNLSMKLLSVSFDNHASSYSPCFYQMSVVEAMKDRLVKNNIFCPISPHLRCSTHVVDIITREIISIPEIYNLITKVHSLLSFIFSTQTSQAAFQNACAKVFSGKVFPPPPSVYTPILNMCGEYTIVELEYFKNCFEAVKIVCKNCDFVSEKEFDVIQQIVRILSPLNRIKVLLKMQTLPSTSSIAFLLLWIEIHASFSIGNLVVGAQEVWEKYWQSMYPGLFASHLLDPRFKTIRLQRILENTAVPEENQRQIICFVRNKFLEVMQFYRTNCVQYKQTQDQKQPFCIFSEDPDFTAEYIIPQITCEEELDIYLNCKAPPPKLEKNEHPFTKVCEWWTVQGHSFPTLYHMFLDFGNFQPSPTEEQKISELVSSFDFFDNDFYTHEFLKSIVLQRNWIRKSMHTQSRNCSKSPSHFLDHADFE